MLKNMKKILYKQKSVDHTIVESGHNSDYGSINVVGFQMHSEVSSIATNFDPTDKKRHESDSINGSMTSFKCINENLSIDDAVGKQFCASLTRFTLFLVKLIIDVATHVQYCTLVSHICVCNIDLFYRTFRSRSIPNACPYSNWIMFYGRFYGDFSFGFFNFYA